MKALARNLVQTALGKAGYRLVRKRDWDEAFGRWPGRVEGPAPDADAIAALRGDHPELSALRDAYKNLNVPATAHSLWGQDYVQTQVNMQRFRDHSAYVWVYRELPRATQLKYYVYARYVQELCPEVLETLDEDGAFGCLCYDFEDLGRVSRDRLDSALEIAFLERNLGTDFFQGARILDIGAGYGRMAHRMHERHPEIAGYICTDSVAESSYLCRFYLKHRGLENSTTVLPLNQLVEDPGRIGEIDLVINVHSFSECRYEAIRWWFDQLEALGPLKLFIVPNDPEEFLATEPDGSKKDFLPLIEERGFRMTAKEPVFRDSNVRELLNIQDHQFLFERR